MLIPCSLTLQNFSCSAGIDKPPVFRWKYEPGSKNLQSAYRIVISTMKEETVFDSGYVRSNEQNNIPAVFPMNSHTKYRCTVYAWDENGVMAQSEPSFFQTGIIGAWKAKWITAGTAKPFYAFREFEINKPVSQSLISVCGLGQFKMMINGRKVGDHELDPGWTNYNEQVQYITFDVTDYLQPGRNRIMIEVANGWYIGDTSEGRHFYTMHAGYKPFGDVLPLIAEMTILFDDDTQEMLLTDDTWKTLPSATTLANVYGSEDYDATRYPGFDGLFECGDAVNAKILTQSEQPKGELTAMAHPPVKVKKVYDTIAITEPEPGKFLFDLGQNMSGLFEIFVRCQIGQKIRIIPVEKLTPEGKIAQSCNTWSSYTLAGTGEIESWKPSFAYSAGRWVQIEGATRDETDLSKPYIADVKGHFITSSARDCGEFSCSDRRYNSIFHIIHKAIESNLNHVHSDCPTVEKLGLLETTHLMAPSLMYNKDVDTLLNKIARDIRESQYKDDEYDVDTGVFPHKYGPGLIPSISPRYAKFIHDFGDGSFWDIVPWGSTVLLAPLFQYQFYGNQRMLIENYETAKRYVDYLKQKYDAYNETYGKPGPHKFLCHGLGDWGVGRQWKESRENVETAFFYVDLRTMQHAAELCGNKEDQAYYSAIADEVLADYNDALLVLNPDTGEWCYRAWDTPDRLNIMQANQAIPLYFNMVPEDKRESVERTFLESVSSRRFVSGEIGLRYIFQVLSRLGRHDIIHDMIMQPEHPSYWRFVAQGETTLPEFWDDNARSRNHDMMGHIMEWFYEEVGGIRSGDAFANIKIAPHLPGNLNWVRCRYDSIRGMISTYTVRTAEETRLIVEIPTNTRGVVYPPDTAPGTKILCNGAEVELNENGYPITAGKYEFVIKNKTEAD